MAKPGIETMLDQILAVEGSVEDPTLTSTGGVGGSAEVDVAAFIEDIGKTADALDKAAEALPTQPALLAKQLKYLDNPMAFTKKDVHDGHRQHISQILPPAASSREVPPAVDAIQKQASSGSSSWLARRLG